MTDAQFLLKKVNARGGKIINSPDELAAYYRPNRIHGNLLQYIKDNVAEYGYTLITHHSSITGETVWYFDPEAL